MSLQSQIFSLRTAIVKAKREVKAKAEREESEQGKRSRQDLISKQRQQDVNGVQEDTMRVEELRKIISKTKKHKGETKALYNVPFNELPKFSIELKNQIKIWQQQRKSYISN